MKRDGILVVEPRKGIYVALPTMKEVIELLEMREVLEGLAARRVANGASAQIVRELRECFAGIDESSLNDQRIEFASADHLFHQTLVEASGSEELVKKPLHPQYPHSHDGTANNRGT